MEDKERFAKLEEAVDQIKTRLNHVETAISDLRKEFMTELRSNFRMTLMVLLGSWVTIIGTFVALFVALLNRLP